MKIEWAESAIADLESIRDYIARDSAYYAAAFVEKILNAVEALEWSPERGRRVPEARRETIHELLFQDYRIIYLIEPHRLQILAVIHGSRDLTRRTIMPWDIV